MSLDLTQLAAHIDALIAAHQKHHDADQAEITALQGQVAALKAAAVDTTALTALDAKVVAATPTDPAGPAGAALSPTPGAPT